MTFENENPFALRSTLEYEMPDFSRINDDSYLPAFYAGCEEQLGEVAAITAQSEVTFENTIVAMERSGQMLMRMLMVFYNKSSSDTSDRLDEIEAEIAPKLAAHMDEVRLNQALFSRIKHLHENRDSLELGTEDAWLLERYYLDFTHAGAHLTDAQREELMVLNEKLSGLETKFGTNLLNDTNDLGIFVEDIAELDGLDENQIAACAAAAKDRDQEGKYFVAMVNFTGNPALANLTHRGLREKIMKASLLKGGRDNENDNRPVLLEIVKLRAQRAELFGVKTHAEYVLQDRNAQNPENVHKMLKQIAPAAVRNARAEGAELQKSIEAAGENFELASWDWDLYTEKVRLAKYNLDTSKMKPYFELERVLHDGVFFAANKLFGITFKERKDIKTYHPEARAFEVFNEDGSKLALFIGDFFTRDSKRGGAWMNNLVDQNHLLGQLPVVVNNLNIPKPPEGQPALLTYDETTTLFHEFGHALHGFLSDVKYPRFSGTSVERDFVEFPSQVNEMWITWPEVLDNYARHYVTGEKLPQEWVDNLKAASAFNEGHATTSYLAAAILDLAWHSLPADATVTDVEEFEAKAIADYGLDYSPVPTRYRSTYFSHIFAGGYSAGYYGYIWSEVLDADTVNWFKENGGMTRENGEHFRQSLLSRGGSLNSMQMFRNFRGQDATIEPLLKRRGLL
ncbi:MAG: M3 family peptidase [Microbacteriaceae bacterium]|nr:M3 family peptidase [Microbacteriaceae bacterium]NBS61824.1 M3 family peptidase [Microbacteriaceae bacterium]